MWVATRDHPRLRTWVSADFEGSSCIAFYYFVDLIPTLSSNNCRTLLILLIVLKDTRGQSVPSPHTRRPLVFGGLRRKRQAARHSGHSPFNSDNGNHGSLTWNLVTSAGVTIPTYHNVAGWKSYPKEESQWRPQGGRWLLKNRNCLSSQGADSIVGEAYLSEETSI